tara:strand:- start:497 stop:1012 length:516 start_codon:yes stop_codon:yes gene_type:complete
MLTGRWMKIAESTLTGTASTVTFNVGKFKEYLIYMWAAPSADVSMQMTINGVTDSVYTVQEGLGTGTGTASATKNTNAYHEVSANAVDGASSVGALFSSINVLKPASGTMGYIVQDSAYMDTSADPQFMVAGTEFNKTDQNISSFEFKLNTTGNYAVGSRWIIYCKNAAGL